MLGSARAEAEQPPEAAAAPKPTAAAPGASGAPVTVPGGSIAPLAESLTGLARAEYAGARILYEDGDFRGALTKLASALKESGDPRLLWNMAACEKQLRHYARVIELLQRYLREGRGLITKQDEQSTEQLLETVGAFVNHLKVVSDPADAELLIDGEKVAQLPREEALLVDMGKHLLELRKPGFVSAVKEVELAGGQDVTVEMQMQLELHEGTLRIVSSPDAVIRVDGKVVGTATWSGRLPSGVHEVYVSAPGKQPHSSEVTVRDDDTSAVHVALQASPTFAQAPPGGSSAWWWVVGGALVAGAGVGTYFMLRPGSPAPAEGTLGSIDL